MVFKAAHIGCGQVRRINHCTYVDFNRCGGCQSACVGYCIAELGWSRVVRVGLEFDLAVVEQLHGAVFGARNAGNSKFVTVDIGIIA